MLLNLLSDMKGENVKIFIVNDGSTEDYSKVIDYLTENFEYNYTKTRYNLGKTGYWQNINYLYEQLRSESFDYYAQFADDLRLAPDFFDKAIKLYESIDDKNKICLNPMLLNEVKTQRWHKSELIHKGDVYLSQWVDGCFISTKQYFEQLNYQLTKPKLTNKISSGIGAQITQRLTRKGFNMYMVKESLIEHGTHESKMHKEHREKRPLTAQI